MKSTKNGRKTERKIVSIDVTDIYEQLKKRSEEEIRSVEEQCKFFVKKGLDEIHTPTTTITYIQHPEWGNYWDMNTTPSIPSCPPHPNATKAEWNAYCEDVSLNAKTGSICRPIIIKHGILQIHITAIDIHTATISCRAVVVMENHILNIKLAF